MKNGADDARSTMNRIHRSRAFATMLCVSSMLVACSNDLRWTEDVRLPDGRVVTLKRWVEFDGGSSHFGDPSTESRQTFEFKHPDTGEVVQWRNEMPRGRFSSDAMTPAPDRFDDGPGGVAPATLNTVALWIARGRPMLLAKPAYGGDFERFFCPNPPYLLYEYAGGRWHSNPLAEVGIKRIRANLTTSAINARAQIEQSGRHLDVEQTSNSFTYRDGVARVPYVLTFEVMPQQTFDFQTCSRSSGINYLLTEGN